LRRPFAHGQHHDADFIAVTTRTNRCRANQSVALLKGPFGSHIRDRRRMMP
jgi:hypothetical protein